MDPSTSSRFSPTPSFNSSFSPSFSPCLSHQLGGEYSEFLRYTPQDIFSPIEKMELSTDWFGHRECRVFPKKTRIQDLEKLFHDAGIPFAPLHQEQEGDPSSVSFYLWTHPSEMKTLFQLLSNEKDFPRTEISPWREEALNNSPSHTPQSLTPSSPLLSSPLLSSLSRISPLHFRRALSHKTF